MTKKQAEEAWRWRCIQDIYALVPIRHQEGVSEKRIRSARKLFLLKFCMEHRTSIPAIQYGDDLAFLYTLPTSTLVEILKALQKEMNHDGRSDTSQ